MKLKILNELYENIKAEVSFLNTSLYEINSVAHVNKSFGFGEYEGFKRHYTQRCIITRLNEECYLYSRGSYRVCDSIIVYGGKWCYKHNNEAVYKIRKDIAQIEPSEELIRALRKVYNVVFTDETELTDGMITDMKEKIDENMTALKIDNREQWWKYKEAAQNKYKALKEQNIDMQCEGTCHAPELANFGLTRGNLLEEGVAQNSLYKLRQGYVERAQDNIWVINKCDNKEEFRLARLVDGTILDTTYTQAKIFLFKENDIIKSITYMRLIDDKLSSEVNVFIVNTHRTENDYIWEPIEGHIYRISDIPNDLKYMALKLIWVTHLKAVDTSLNYLSIQAKVMDECFEMYGVARIIEEARKLKCSYNVINKKVYRETWEAANRSKVVKTEEVKDVYYLTCNKDHTGYNAHSIDYIIKKCKYTLNSTEFDQFDIFINNKHLIRIGG